MEPVVIAALIGIGVYMGVMALIPSRLMGGVSQYTKGQLRRLEQGAVATEENSAVLRQPMEANGFAARIFYAMPLARAMYPRLLKAGIATKIEPLFFILLASFLILVFVLKGLGIASLILAIIATYFLAWTLINRRIAKRNSEFLNIFPDALDTIVRSVRSGYPINSAIQIVAQNLPQPVGGEFKQVSDEISYGSTLLAALQRLADRIDEQDVRFFVVVLSVQQDVGGNIGEVLSNLSAIIRKRKHLRLKIQALTSEGRATAWVLGALPLFVAVLIHFVAPNHLTPLFTTHLGNIILAIAIGIVLLGMFIVKQMINIEV